MISALKRWFWSPISSKEKVEKYQTIIRDSEWNDLKEFIPRGSSFLDIGCGAGYNLLKAREELNCTVTGIDPSPGSHGVGRFSGTGVELEILQGSAENLPFEENSFDVIFCSHVLEHVTDEDKSLEEIKRVLKGGGVLIIGMPTALMSWISYFSIMTFTTHIQVLFFFKSLFKKDVLTRFRRIFIPDSHSKPRATLIWYDLIMYRVRRWNKVVGRHLTIQKKLKPFLYPYPDYYQFFKIKRSKLGSSSVFFICKK